MTADELRQLLFQLDDQSLTVAELRRLLFHLPHSATEEVTGALVARLNLLHRGDTLPAVSPQPDAPRAA